MKKQNGITLIALVITIIVLLILAGITIAMIAGQDSAPAKAVEARNANKVGEAKDAAALLITGYIQDYYNGKYVGNEAAAKNATDVGEYINAKLETAVTKGEHTFQVVSGELTVSDSNGTAIVTGTINSNGTITWNGEATNSGNSGNNSGSTTPATPTVTLNVGDTVNYPSAPTADASFTVPSYPESDGSSTDGVKITVADENLTWKVWKKEGSNYLITPTTPTATKVYLRGAKGYNNAVQALNAYCRKYYSDASNGVYARSINMNDIEGAMTSDGITARENYDNYNQTVSPSTKTNYPGIYPLESAGTKGLSDAPEASEYAVWSGDDSKSDGATAYSSGYKKTYYNFSNSDITTNDYYDSNTENLLFSSTGYGSGFWVASRCVYVESDNAYFYVRRVSSSGNLNSYSMFRSSGDANGISLALRPVVSIPESKIGDYVSN